MMRAATCAFVMLTSVAAALGVVILVVPDLSAAQTALLIAPLVLLVVALFYVKPDGGSVDFYWARMFAHPGAPRWRRTLHGMAMRLGVVRRYGRRQ